MQVRKSKKSWLFVIPDQLKSALPPKKSVTKSKKSCEPIDPELSQSHRHSTKHRSGGTKQARAAAKKPPAARHSAPVVATKQLPFRRQHLPVRMRRRYAAPRTTPPTLALAQK